MESTQPDRGSIIFPELHYDDARAGIAFLERAFGFERHLIVPGDGGGVVHAELRAGRSFLMLGSAGNDGYAYRTPRSIGGVNTGSVYTALSDVDALYARAKNAGARIVRELADTDYGSRDFSACDPEGFLWNFGTYRPGAGAETASEPEIFAGMRYRDARGAIAWLSRAFGFEEHFVVPGEGDEIAHAELRLGASILMLGSGRDDEFDMKTPRDLDGAYTQTLNVYVSDADAHSALARAAGAEIVEPPSDTSYGTRGYVVRDPEGYVWNFNTYRPRENAAGERARASKGVHIAASLGKPLSF